MRIIRPALVVACAALLALALAASRAQAAPRPAAGLRVVASFNPAQGQNPENLVVAPDGTVYVTWLFAHAVVAVRPDGSQMAVSLPPGEATGIAIDPVADGRLTVGLISADPQAAGIWTVPLTAFAGHGAPSRLVALPAAAFPNGLAYAPDGTLYVADSARGLILKVPAGNSAAVTWLSSSLLTPTGAAFDGVTLPGVNGLKVSRAGCTRRTPRATCCSAYPSRLMGPPSPRSSGPGWPSTTSSSPGAARLQPRSTSVTKSSGSPETGRSPSSRTRHTREWRTPSAVAFGPGRRLFITSAAYFGSHPALQVTRKPLDPGTRRASR